jgi:hypothetical protein
VVSVLEALLSLARYTYPIVSSRRFALPGRGHRRSGQACHERHGNLTIHEGESSASLNWRDFGPKLRRD